MKKILLVTRSISPPWDEASKNFAYTLAKGFSKKEDLKMCLLTNGIVSDLPKNTCQKPIYTSNDFSYYQKMRLIKHLRKLRNDFDILHYLFTPTKQNSFLIKNFIQNKKAKSIQTVATLREDLFSDKELKDLIFADAVVTYSDYAKNKLNSLGFDNVHRIYPGIDLSYYSPASKDSQLMESFKINPDEFVISYPGEYSRLGATDLITDSLTEIFEKIPNGKFIFACRVKNEKDQKTKKEVIEKLKEKNILDKVVFSDTFADMPKLYNLSDVVIFPVGNMKGKFDVPLAVIEAMACEKPVIISDIPILQEFSNDKNSIQVKSGDSKELIDAVIGLFNNKEKSTYLGTYSRIYVKENFDIKNVTQQYEEIYNQI